MAFELRRIAFGLGVGDGRHFLRETLADLRNPDRHSSAPAPAFAIEVDET